MGHVFPIDTVYKGDLIDGDRELLQEESTLFDSGYGYKIENHTLVDITQSTQYITQKENESKLIKIEDLKSQIKDLDLKSIRAIREDGVKDQVTGQTWIEYYTSQINDLRQQLTDLSK